MSDDTTTTTADEARRMELLRRLQSGTRERVRAVQLARDGDRIRRRLELEEWLVMNSVSIADLLDELARTREATRWIPVSERLPEDGSKVLICTVPPDKGLARHVGESYWCGEGLWSHPNWNYDMPLGYATHWMPMPEPPQPQVLADDAGRSTQNAE